MTIASQAPQQVLWKEDFATLAAKFRQAQARVDKSEAMKAWASGLANPQRAASAQWQSERAQRIIDELESKALKIREKVQIEQALRDEPSVSAATNTEMLKELLKIV